MHEWLSMRTTNTSAILGLRAWIGTLFVLGRLEECSMRAPSFHSVSLQTTDYAERNVGKPQNLTPFFLMRLDATKKATEQAAVIAGTSVLTPAMSAYAAGGGTIASFLAGRTGAGLIGAGTDALAQGLEGKQFDPFSMGISFMTGSLGAGRGLVTNVGLNTAGAVVDTWMSNLFYGTNDNMADAARRAAIGSAIGYGVGYGIGAGYNKALTINENTKINTPDWTSIGPGMYARRALTRGRTFCPTWGAPYLKRCITGFSSRAPPMPILIRKAIKSENHHPISEEFRHGHVDSLSNLYSWRFYHIFFQRYLDWKDRGIDRDSKDWILDDDEIFCIDIRNRIACYSSVAWKESASKCLGDWR